ncbi:MAG: hypothetical protein GY761_21555 [Hyphomicrobiales bacterium]|nr:hypothetical protein [Hyphomicrobiales bacterium]
MLVTEQAGFDANNAIQEFRSAAENIGMPLSITVVEDEATHRLYQAPITLIRPDLMAAWQGAEYAGKATSILNIVRGA